MLQGFLILCNYLPLPVFIISLKNLLIFACCLKCINSDLKKLIFQSIVGLEKTFSFCLVYCMQYKSYVEIKLYVFK